jgi:hypothetical protein
MKTMFPRLIVGLVLLAPLAWSQAIDVKPGGIDIGAVATGSTGPVLQIAGADATFATKTSANTTLVNMVVKGNGDAVVTGSATVGSLVVGTSPIFTQGTFESAEQQIPGSGVTLVVPHGLSGLPRFATVSLRCISAEFGWAVGDEIMISSVHMRSDNSGCTTAINATSFKLRQNSNLYIHRADASGSDNITTTKWRLVFRAWR